MGSRDEWKRGSQGRGGVLGDHEKACSGVSEPRGRSSRTRERETLKAVQVGVLLALA